MLLVIFERGNAKTLFLLTTDVTWKKFHNTYINTIGGGITLLEDELLSRIYYEETGEVREAFVPVEDLNQLLIGGDKIADLQIKEVIICGICS